MRLAKTTQNCESLAFDQLTASQSLRHATPVRTADPGLAEHQAHSTIEALELERESLIDALAIAHKRMARTANEALQLPFAWLVVNSAGKLLQISDQAAVMFGRKTKPAPDGSEALPFLDKTGQQALDRAIGALKRYDLFPAIDARQAPGIQEVWMQSLSGKPIFCAMRVTPYRYFGQTVETFAVTFAETPEDPSLLEKKRNDSKLKTGLGQPVQFATISEIQHGDFTGNNELLRSIDSALVDDITVQDGLRALDLEVLEKNAPSNWTYVKSPLVPRGAAGSSGAYVFHKFPMHGFQGRVEGIGTIGFALDHDFTIAGANHTERRKTSDNDTLTGCLSRAAILGMLEGEVAKARHSGKSVSVVSLDLDGFKAINDGFGHHVGDSLLKAAASRMRQSIAEQGFVGRLSGDEFLIVIPGLKTSNLKKLVYKMLDEIRAPLLVEGSNLIITCSVGVSSFPTDADNGLDLVRASDIALYKSKESGRDMLTVFEQSMFEARNRSLRIISRLHQALAKEEFRLVYQPQYELSGTGRIVGAEALIRWDDAEIGKVTPTEFIPLAYQCGLGLSIDLWVVKSALSRKAKWDEDGFDLTISINTSASSFLSVGFAKQILALIALNQIEPSKVRIEVTETTLMQKSPVCNENLNVLRVAGVGISIDDFGTGYSSLAAIHELNPTEVKIDQRFVSRISENSSDATKPLELILSFAHSLGFQVVAEGIETAEQLAWLTAKGCKIGQGYLLSQPVEKDDLNELLCVFPKAASQGGTCAI